MPARHDALRAARLALAALALAVALAACASVPSQEMSDARRALAAALESGAREHAPAAVSRAEDALDEASAALRAGRYERARAHAAAARAAAIDARTFAGAVARAQAAIEAARGAGRPWRGAQRMLDQALAASRTGDAARALDIVERALALAR